MLLTAPLISLGQKKCFKFFDSLDSVNSVQVKAMRQLLACGIDIGKSKERLESFSYVMPPEHHNWIVRNMVILLKPKLV